MRKSLLALVIFGIVGATIDTRAATLTNLPEGESLIELKKDGSTKPPGDRIRLTVLLYPSDANFKLTVRALRFPAKDAAPIPFRAGKLAGAEYSDSEKNLRYIKKLEIEKGKAITEHAVELVIPYLYFDRTNLPDGDYRMYYEVEGSHEENGQTVVDFTTPTEVTILQLGNTERTEMVALPGPPEVIPRKKFQKGFLIPTANLDDWDKEDAYKVDVKDLKATDVTLPDRIVIASEPGDKVTVEPIKGKFGRANVVEDPEKGDTAALFVPLPQREVFYATNREFADKTSLDPEKRFKADVAARILYGKALVNIPVAKHKKGKLETKGWLNADPSKVFLVHPLSEAPLSEADFFSKLSKDDVLLFVHGFNTSFSDALLRVAQFQHDMEFPGLAAIFSWPSRGEAGLKPYLDDLGMAEKSYHQLAKVMRTLVEDPNRPGQRRKGKLHIFAHSMGSFVTIRAIDFLVREKFFTKDQKPFGSIVFAAPDVDINVFASLLPRVVTLSQNLTYYYSTLDVALTASPHRENRAGLYPFFYDGVSTICTDKANSRLVEYGHTYFANSDRLLLDFSLLLMRGLGPDKRTPPLVREELKDFPGFAHYTFQQIH